MQVEEHNKNEGSYSIQNRLRSHSFIVVMAILLSLPSFGSTPIYLHETTSEEQSRARKAIRDWERQIIQSMKKEDLPKFRVRMHDFNYMAEILKQPTQSIGALYLLATECDDPSYKHWCNEHNVIELLRDTAPENAAVYFENIPGSSYPNTLEAFTAFVTQENIERLRLASEASFVDQYSADEASMWRNLVKKHVLENPFPSEITFSSPESDPRAHNIRASYRYPAEMLAVDNLALDQFKLSGSDPLENIDVLCVAMAVMEHLEGIEYCRIFANLLLNNSQERTHKELGYRIEYYYQHILDAEDPIYVWWNISRSPEAKLAEQKCSKPIWYDGTRVPLGGLEELDAFYEDLAEFGITGSLSRAQKRELEFAGLALLDAEFDDPCMANILNEKLRLRHVQ